MRRPTVLAPVASAAVEATNSVAPTPVLTNALPNALPTNPVPSSSQTITATNDIAAANKAYQQGLIGKEDLIKTIVAEQNKQSQDFYGKVIDQTGEPVAGVTVTGELMIDTGEDIKTKEVHTTQTDAEGLFQFTGGEGSELAVVVNKAGYEMGARGEGYKGPVGKKTSPTDRAVFTMWKARGAEPMTYREFHSRVPYDGTSATLNLATGEKTGGGDLRITLLRTPLQVRRGIDKYDWTVKIEMLAGGLLAENDAYPYWAPETGYQPFFAASMSSNDVPWSAELNQNFYIKNQQGQFGRLFIDLSTDSMRPDTGITIETWINPSGSQNLEFDPSKQIR